MQTLTDLQNQGDNEKAIIYSILRRPEIYNLYADRLHAGLFSQQENKEIFRSLKSLVDAGEKIEIMPVYGGCDQKLIQGVSLNSFIKEISEAPYIDQDVENYIDYLNVRWERVLFLNVTAEGNRRMISGESIHAVIAWMSSQIENTHQGTNFIKISESMALVLENIEFRAKNNGQLSGVPTGLRDFDRFSNGFQKSDLVIIAGETSQGKTSLAVTAAKNQSFTYRIPVLFLSLEMSHLQLSARVMAQQTGISSKTILTEVLYSEEFERLQNNILKVKDAPFFIDSGLSSDVEDMVAIIHTAVAKHKVEVVYVDYLQLVTSKARYGTKEEEVGTITRIFKNLAKKLNISIAVLSQLRRTQSGSPKPTMSRLRSSGQIEEAADIVWFVWRPEYYGIEDIILNDGTPFPSQELAHLIVAKGRNIGVTDFVAKFEKPTTHFVDYDAKDFKQEKVGADDVKAWIKNDNIPF